MSALDQTDFDDLLSRYLDAELDALEEGALVQYLTDEALARRFLEMTKLNAEIAGLSAAPVPDTVMAELVLGDLRGESGDTIQTPSMEDYADEPTEVSVPVHSLKKFYLAPLLALAACICFLAVSGHYFLGRAPSPHPLNVATVRGEVYFTTASGKVSLAGNQPLKGDGKIETIGPDSHASVILVDGTQLDLEGDSALVMELEHDKHRLSLDAGTMHAQVVKQPGTSKLIFATANADTVVHGTKFILSLVNSTTYVIVTEGVVSVRRPDSDTELEVNAGFYTHVEGDGKFRPWPLNRLPKALQDEVNSGK